MQKFNSSYNYKTKGLRIATQACIMRVVMPHYAVTNTNLKNYCEKSEASSTRELLRENDDMQAIWSA